MHKEYPHGVDQELALRARGWVLCRKESLHLRRCQCPGLCPRDRVPGVNQAIAHAPWFTREPLARFAGSWA